jgi:hypothetical protein
MPVFIELISDVRHIGETKMSVFSNSKMDSVYYDDMPAYEGEDCEVKIDEDEIVVSYKDKRRRVIYKGKEKGQGHYNIGVSRKTGKSKSSQIP